MQTDALAIPIRTDADIVSARQAVRTLGTQQGFTPIELTRLATAITELARNIVTFAGSGEVCIDPATGDGRRGVTMRVSDEGPGIEDVERALRDGFTTGTGLGIGLPGARRLMDEFEITTAPGEGTTIRATKWARA
jgi:serine/threonine-protein kinase RsbT